MRIYAFAFSILFATTSFSAPTTSPSTQPSLADLQKSRDAAEASLIAVKKSSLESLKQTPEYRIAVADRDLLESKLNQARQSGSQQDRLDASRKFVAAKERVRKMEEAAVDGNQAVKDASDEVDRLLQAIEKRKKEISAAILNDPMNVAIGEGKVVLGMTEDQAEHAFKNKSPRQWSGRVVPAGIGGYITFRKTENNLGSYRQVTFVRIQEVGDGRENELDRTTVTIAEDGKVKQIFNN